MTIQLRRSQLKALLIWLCIGSAFVLAIPFPYLLGRVITPFDRAGQPMLLSPGTLALLTYRQQAEEWLTRTGLLLDRVEDILTTSESAPLTAISRLKDIITDADWLGSDFENLSAPAEALPFQTTFGRCVALTWSAVDAVQAYLTGPSADRKAAVQQAILQARTQLTAAREARTW